MHILGASKCIHGSAPLSFAASLGASVLSDRLESAKATAREAAERAATAAAAQAATVQEQARAASARAQQVAQSAAAMDSSQLLELGQANAAALRDSAAALGQANAAALRDSAAALGTKVSSMSVDDFRSITASPGGIASGASAHGGMPQHHEDGSDSGGDDASYGASSFASRFGFGTARIPEKEGLLKQPGSGEAPASAAGTTGGLASGGLATLRSMSERTLHTGTGFARSVGSGLGLVEEKPREPEGTLDRLCFKLCACCPRLTRTQQLLGFAICFFFGAMISLSALSSLPSLLIGNPAPFAFKYTFGNLLSLGSSSFLVGPSKQCRDMLQPERRTASLLYLSSLTGTVVSVFFLKIQILSFCFVVLQFCALTWYMLSYVPYGQQCLKRILARAAK